MAHEVGKVFGDGEVAVARHFLARVDDARVVETGLPFLHFLSETRGTAGRYFNTHCTNWAQPAVISIRNVYSIGCKHRLTILLEA